MKRIGLSRQSPPRESGAVLEEPARTRFDAVVFDCDGVLVDSELLSMRTSHRIVVDLGWDVDLDTMLRTFVGCSAEYFVEQIERNLGRRLEPGWEEPYREWREEGRRAFYDELKAMPGIVEALERITLPVAVASNSGHVRIRKSLQVTGLMDRFEGRISSAEDVEAGKPAPDVYLHAAGRLGVEPERCIAIDDSRFGVAAAHQAGMTVFAFGEHWRTGDLPSSRVRVLRDLTRLPLEVDRLARGDT